MTIESLRTALELDGGFGDRKKQLDEFFDVTLPPQ